EAGIPDNFLPLLSQNISIIEVGAYSQIFEEFIRFIGIKSLILTDIDSFKEIEEEGKMKQIACPVNEGIGTSNSAIKHFLGSKEWEELKTLSLEERTISIGDSKVCLSYQQQENEYHARSFEDAFIHINLDF